MILTLGNRKGGVGKSTSAVYLATGLARLGRTLIVDADAQGSILSWSEDAGETFPAGVVQWSTRDLAKRVKDVAGTTRTSSSILVGRRPRMTRCCGKHCWSPTN